jgi:murein endopeptidase
MGYDELVDIVVSGSKNYKGWKCVFVGDGTIVMENGGRKISGHSSKFHNWLSEAWEDCKKKIDQLR